MEDFAQLADPYRRELLTHCYRMVGSMQDAEDLVQETLLRAWRAYGQYDERRASLRTWLYRIATNACLTALRGRERRPLPSGLGLPDQDPWGPLRPGAEIPWLQPIPDDPADVLSARGDLRLAFVAALQVLPARQRAILILRDVLDLPAKDVAETLETTTTAVNSGLRRARERLAEMTIDQLDEPGAQQERVEKYVRAFEAADLDALTRLLTDDVILEMPPLLTWFRGRPGYATFTRRAWAMRGTDWRMVGVGANGQPAAASYVREPHNDQYRLHALHILTITRPESPVPASSSKSPSSTPSPSRAHSDHAVAVRPGGRRASYRYHHPSERATAVRMFDASFGEMERKSGAAWR